MPQTHETGPWLCGGKVHCDICSLNKLLDFTSSLVRVCPMHELLVSSSQLSHQGPVIPSAMACLTSAMITNTSVAMMIVGHTQLLSSAALHPVEAASLSSRRHHASTGPRARPQETRPLQRPWQGPQAVTRKQLPCPCLQPMPRNAAAPFDPPLPAASACCKGSAFCTPFGTGFSTPGPCLSELLFMIGFQ